MIIVFDIDSTLADITHRLHYIKREKKDWDSFFSACGSDSIILPMATLYKSLEPKNVIYLITGRREQERQQTMDWLAEHDIRYDALLMRKRNDFRKDYVIKREYALSIIDEAGSIDLAVDDSPEVIKMYRELGIFTLDVNQGDR